MKVFGIILLVLLVVGAGLVYTDGAHMPLNHSVSVSGVVAAPQVKVFALITDVKNGYVWRPEVKSVTTLDPDQGRDHWVEHLAHGQFMTFLAVRTVPPTPARGHSSMIRALLTAASGPMSSRPGLAPRPPRCASPRMASSSRRSTGL